MTLTWKEEIVEQGLNKTQLKEVKQIVHEEVSKALQPVYEALDKISKAVQANADAIATLSKRIK